MAKKYKFGKKPMIVWYGKLFYSCGNTGVAFITQTFTGFILFYGTIICRIPAGLMGLAFSIGAMWDGITEPLVGYITDNTKSKLMGKRHGYMIVSVFLLSLLNILIWSVPQNLDTSVKFLWITLGIILLHTLETFYSTPHSALGVELAGDYEEQTVLQSVKSVFFLIGTIAPTVIMALLQANPAEGITDGRYDPNSYLNMAFISSFVMLFTGFISVIGTYSHVPRLNKKAMLINNDNNNKFSFKAIVMDFIAVIKEKNYRAIIVGYAVAMVASAFLTGVGMYMFTYTFKVDSTQMYVLLGVLFLATILSQPLWAYLSNKIDKKPALQLSIIIAIVGIIAAFFVFLYKDYIPTTDELVKLLLGPLFFAGIGVGGLYPLPSSIMADIIAYDAEKTKQDKTATFASFMTFALKLSQSATLLIIGLTLELIGFKVPEGTGIYIPPRSAELGLGYLFFAGVVISLIAAMLFIRSYSLKKTDIPTHTPKNIPVFEVDRLLTEIEVHQKNKEIKKNNKSK